MKVTVQPQPPEYTADKAVILIDDKGDTILIGCLNAKAKAYEIARAVNLHDAMLTVMKVLGSNEMGGPLLGMIESSGMPEDGVDKLKRLINAVDVILKGEELSLAREMEHAHQG